MLTKNATLYDTDFYAWANEQASLLRAGRLTEADVENIAEEIESMGKRERRELTSRIAVLLLHLLKWRYQPGYRCRSWQSTISGQRVEVRDHLGENPSLTAQLDELMHRAYRSGRVQAIRETGFGEGVFPAICPFTFDEAMKDDFWPE